MKKIKLKNIPHLVILKKIYSKQRIILLVNGNKQILKQNSFANFLVCIWNYIKTIMATTTGKVEAINYDDNILYFDLSK